MVLNLHHPKSEKPRYVLVLRPNNTSIGTYDIIDTSRGDDYIYAGNLRYGPADHITRLLNDEGEHVDD